MRPLRTIRSLTCLIPAIQASLWIAQVTGAPMTQPAGASAETAMIEAAGKTMQIGGTRHFLIAYDTAKSRMGNLAGNLERTYHAVYGFCGQLGLEVTQPTSRLEILFFDRPEDFARYVQRIGADSTDTYGIYDERSGRSAFFNVLNAPEVIQLAAELETSRYNLDELLGAIRKIPSAQIQVEIRFHDGRTRQFTRQEAEEHLHKTRARLRQLDRQRTAYLHQINQTVLRHETAHQVLHHAGIHPVGSDNPRWLVEGLACLFETPAMQPGQDPFAVNDLRLADFRHAVSGREDPTPCDAVDILRAIEAVRLTPPRQLISNPQVFDRHQPFLPREYATAWALLYYLYKTQPGPLADYLKATRTRKPSRVTDAQDEVRLFRACFGPLDDDLVQRWGLYMCSIQPHSGSTALSTAPSMEPVPPR